MTYPEFLASKAAVDVPTGFEPKGCKLIRPLFDFQQDVVNWSVRRGRAALFEDCGLGKTAQQLVWAQEVSHDGPVLILAPLAVGDQTAAEGESIGINVRHVASQADVEFYSEDRIFITNYEKLHRFKPEHFSGVVLDECFPKNTIVDVIENGIILKRYIQHVKANDTILNAAGFDRVAEAHRRKIERAVKIKVGGNWITSSENHPFFTQRGWMPASRITEGDSVMETGAALRLVSGRGSADLHGGMEQEVLREILLSEMAHEAIIGSSQCSQRGCGKAARRGQVAMACVGRSESQEGDGSYSGTQSNVESRSQSEGERDIANDEAQTFRSWWKRDGYDGAAIAAVGGSTRWMGSRVCLVTGQTKGRLANLLQDGSRAPGIENQYRGGRSDSPFKEAIGFKAGCSAGFVRVESVEILERGHPELEKWRDADGFIYFHDIKGTRHPSFSVNGLLVHNSSILKSYDGATRTAIIEAFRRTPFKLACTATPAPNDYMELGNHAEFLGVMSREEMLAMFFTHDGGETSKWRLKGHAESEFWKWLCSWAVNIRKPSDLGYDDGAFKLPPLNLHEHIVESGQTMDGYLFALPASSLAERREARKCSLNERVEKAAEIANSNDEPWIAWCNLNSESVALAKEINGAVELTGSDSDKRKEQVIRGFLDGTFKRLVTKSSICGFGLNLQHCSNELFVGLSDSYEQFYQAVRRCWRFGQKRPVEAHLVISNLEGAVLANLKRKEADAARMAEEMVKHMADISSQNIRGVVRDQTRYEPKQALKVPEWMAV